MAGTTTAMCSSFKTDLASSLHCFNATVTPTGTPTNASFALTSISSLTGVAVGMGVSGTSIPAGTVVASFTSATALVLSKAATGSPGSETVTFTGDVFNIALVKVTPTGTYGSATTAYANLTGNSDEVANGGGYTTGGQALAANQTPTLTTTTAFWQWSTNPSWTSATFSTTGAIIYNTTQRGPVVGPSVAVYDFGGTQSVSAGTLTLIQPSNTSTTAMLRIA